MSMKKQPWALFLVLSFAVLNVQSEDASFATTDDTQETQPEEMNEAPANEQQEASDTTNDSEELDPEEVEENKDVLDTVDAKSTSGNWVFKNYWWKKIQDVYSDIREQFNAIMTVRMGFFEKRNDIDKELDTFYQKIGLEQGPLQDILEYSLQVIEKEKENQGYLGKKERLFLAKVQSSQRALEQLREDIKAIEELDQKIDDSLEVVLQQVDLCNKYMEEAWNISRDVARELSDKEARKQYYDAKSLLENVEKVKEYLVGPFSKYFEQMKQSAHDHTRTVAVQIATLKHSGLDLKKEAHYFETEEEDIEQKKEEAEERAKELEKRKQKKEGTESVGIVTSVLNFVSNISSPITSFFKSIPTFFSNIFTSMKGLFVSEKKSLVEDMKKVVKKEQALEESLNNERDKLVGAFEEEEKDLLSDI